MSKKKTIPALVKQIKNTPLIEMKYGYQKSISYSQFSMYASCPRKWSLQYRDGHYKPESSIHMTFGTSLHEVIQHYITTIYEVNGEAADRLDLEEYFEECFSRIYLKDYKSNKNVHFSDPVQMKEFFDDGLEIIKAVKKNRSKLFNKKGWYLVGCEVPLLLTPHPEFKNILYKGFLDVVLYHEPTNSFKILDIKTSSRGWDDKTKKDEIKQFQLLLYKKFFAQQFGVEETNIDIQFLIVKRKIWEESPYPLSRVQEFKPVSGKNKMNKATKSINNFIENVFNQDCTYNDKVFEPNPSKFNCTFCPYKNNLELCDKGII